jgi:DNA-binding protein
MPRPAHGASVLRLPVSLADMQSKPLLIVAEGSTVSKAITLAEIAKRRLRGLHQNTQIGVTTASDGSSSVPTIAITLSLTPLDATLLGCAFAPFLPPSVPCQRSGHSMCDPHRPGTNHLSPTTSCALHGSLTTTHWWQRLTAARRRWTPCPGRALLARRARRTQRDRVVRAGSAGAAAMRCTRSRDSPRRWLAMMTVKPRTSNA